MEEIAVSVYCLAYNHKKYIRSALEGFVNQITNFKYEVIVHDDASTDGTSDIIKEYAKKYPNIIKPVIQAENQYSKGVNIFYNFILPIMKGKYVASCEGDDYWTDSHKLQMQFDALETHSECSLCVHRVQCTNEDDSPNPRIIPSEIYNLHGNSVLDQNELLQIYYVIGGYPFHTSSYFYRKEILFEKVDLVRDVGTLRKCFINGGIYFIDKYMSVRRLFTIGNFNSRLRDGGMKKKVAFLNSEIENEVRFNDYTNNEFRNYISLAVLRFVLEIAKLDVKEARKVLKKFKISFSEISTVIPVKRRIKLQVKYIVLIYFTFVYKLLRKIKG